MREGAGFIYRLAGGVGEEKDFRLSSDLNYVGPADYIGEKLVADLPKNLWRREN
jgi:hypothetical protein